MNESGEPVRYSIKNPINVVLKSELPQPSLVFIIENHGQ